MLKRRIARKHRDYPNGSASQDLMDINRKANDSCWFNQILAYRVAVVGTLAVVGLTFVVLPLYVYAVVYKSLECAAY